MHTSQSGITPEANTDAVFLTLLINRDSSSIERIRQTCANIPELTATLSGHYPDARLSSTVSIGSDVWDLLYPSSRPESLRSFPEIEDEGRLAPATSGDLLLHIRANRRDLVFQLMHDILEHFGHSVSVEEEVTGFRYLDSRDLTGFVDGTENPTGNSRPVVALVGEEDSEFSAGSYIHTQRYIHHLHQWNEQPVPEQEKIIGRTKADDIEFSSEEKAPTAHVKRANIKDADGKGMEILRHSMPYGNSKEAGLFFVSYCRTPMHFELMLEAMMKTDEAGHYDHLMNYSTAVTGCAFFAPSVEFLQSCR